MIIIKDKGDKLSEINTKLEDGAKQKLRLPLDENYTSK